MQQLTSPQLQSRDYVAVRHDGGVRRPQQHGSVVGRADSDEQQAEGRHSPRQSPRAPGPHARSAGVAVRAEQQRLLLRVEISQCVLVLWPEEGPLEN